jgi:hypothetical protein
MHFLPAVLPSDFGTPSLLFPVLQAGPQMAAQYKPQIQQHIKLWLQNQARHSPHFKRPTQCKIHASCFAQICFAWSSDATRNRPTGSVDRPKGRRDLALSGTGIWMRPETLV